MGSFKIKAQSTLLGRGYHLGKPQAAKDIWLPDADRKGHMFCFGSTRIGKTKLIELMIEQDIRKGYSVTLFDPKGDIDLLSSIVQVAFEENRQHELCLITPIFPEYSASIDPLAYYFMPEELVSHVVSGIKAKEEFFINIAYETTLIIVLTLLLFAKARNEKCWINLNDIKERASHACLEDLKAELESIPESPEKADILASLMQILDSLKDYFAKISSSLRTTLTSLSTGNVGKIIGRAQSNQFIKRLEQNRRVILVVQTGSLLTRKTAHIVARVLISMIQSFIGRRYASGRRVSPPLAIYLDEASNLMYIGIDELFNPQYLASPLQILWFETDEVATLLIFFIISSLFGGWSWLLLFVGPYLYLRLKKNYPKSFIKHSLYFLGLKTPRNYPSTFEKFFCE
ncbi:MAG: hypothetical protein KAU38_13025 [Desulfobacterales bacterium]|nr:hypothetical protein [Desulfobacterales bacterium]